MENVLENMTEKEMDLDEEKFFENFMRDLVTIGFEYAELNTENEKNEFIKNEGDNIYRFFEEGRLEEYDDDDRHDARVMAEEVIRFVGNLISRASEKGKGELWKHCRFTDED